MAAKKRKKGKRGVKAVKEEQRSALPEPASSEPEAQMVPAGPACKGRKDLRKAFLSRCAEAACQGAEAVNCPRTEEAAAELSGSLLVDAVNCCASPFDGEGRFFPLPVYVCVPGARPVRRRRDGVYREALVSCYELFCDENRKETEHLRQSILRESLQDVPGGRSLSRGYGLMCLIPDVADDFDRVFRSQLCCGDAPLFRVPRSIALAYALQAGKKEVPGEFLCVDYDGEEACAIKIWKAGEEDGPVFVRMGREKLSGKNLSYRRLAEEYLLRYQRKNRLTLTPEAVRNLVDTKLLQHLLQNPEEPVLVGSGEDAAAVRSDPLILDVLRKKVLEDLRITGLQKRIPVYGLCSFFPGGEGLFGTEALEQGCLEIRRRGEENRVLWKEYLPHLELEVTRNGVFDVIELIGEEHRRQNVSAMLEEIVEIPVSNGTVTFPANGEDHYDLPLLREVYGRHGKEKMARFQLPRPLEQDTEVELKVYYRYGDVDSYRLTARSPDLPEPLESVWCDREPLDNLAPSYQELEKHDFGPEDFEKVYKGFCTFAENVRSPRRPPRMRYGSVYENPKGSGRYCSKYLYDLNQRGLPYFHIQNFFQLDAYTSGKSTAYIARMIQEGVFDTVAKVLGGELPAGHNLDAGQNNGQDEGQVLIQNMADIAYNFGCFFWDEDETVKAEVKKVLDYFRKKRGASIQAWAPITRYVLRDHDPHGVWKSFSRALRHMKLQMPRRTIYDLRAISAVCYQTEGWIFEFFHGPRGREDVDWVVENILAVLESPECVPAEGKEARYNPWEIRDVLELLLCICRLKAEDPGILDCNAPRTKELVKRLKEIDRSIRELEERGALKRVFNSRLGIETPKEYRRVNPVIYALIQTLTGGKPVSLIGFLPD